MPKLSAIHTNHATKKPRVNQHRLEQQSLFRATERLHESTAMSPVRYSSVFRAQAMDVPKTPARRSQFLKLQVLEGSATKAIAGLLRANVPERPQSLFHSQYCPTVAQSPSANWVDQ